MLVDCKHKEKCSGCHHLGVSLQEQHERKHKHLEDLLFEAGLTFPTDFQVLSPAASGLRDRADLVVDHGRLGLYGKETREIIDLTECAQFSEELLAWFKIVRTLTFPVTKGSLRLRVGPNGQRGIWLDFANVDIKKILDEKNWLIHLQSLAFVEIGQRHKVPVLEEGVFKLRDPSFQPWFRTWSGGEPVDLYCSVASFTQPGVVANRTIVRLIDEWLGSFQAKHILEFGSGIGNLSFAALGQDRELTACEIDERSLEGFQRSLQEFARKHPESKIESRVKILRGDFQNKNPQDFGQFDTVLVNPPRSGLKQFLAPLVELSNKGPMTGPQRFIYMSCYPKSFAEDGIQLQKAGYQIADLAIVDQFPQTDHYEVLSLWTRGT